ncbi:unnamed protein product [Mycena citricolor]|uniref:Polyketide synthase-like phosphopantetheine-binding domain-containing protein n=1 Tax=Mycena citricolor TaxID=2018698 RepID=A0AAD2K7R0_9AGAR|nr:unnamed protein product [Mycena citricolor]
MSSLNDYNGASSSVLAPPNRSLILPQILDFHLENPENSPAFSFAKEDPQSGVVLTDITRFEFARAAHRAAHLISAEKQVREGGRFVAIVALADVLIYQSIVVGCIRAGLTPFPISHRNSPAAIVHLLQSTNCHRVLTTRASLGHLIADVVSELAAKDLTYELSVDEIPLLGELYPHLGHESVADDFTPYPVSDPIPPATDIALCLHSSGSTGFPKPIHMSHRLLLEISTLGAFNQLTAYAPRFAIGTLPPFHAMGCLMQILFPLVKGGTGCILPPASTATEYHVPPNPTSDLALHHSKLARADGVLAVPAFILDWARSTEAVDYLKSLNIVSFGGGPLTLQVGDELVEQGVKLVTLYGATEFGMPNVIRADDDPRDWAWFKFAETAKLRWVPEGDVNTFELQFLSGDGLHPAVENLPDVQGYSTKDLFERHPTRPDLYRVVGRLDDVLIMANGEKTVPGPMEDIMLSSPHVSGAVMFGRERNQVGVLIEPSAGYEVNTTDTAEVAKFRNLVWEKVQEANESAPAFARIYKEMILVASRAKPLIRTPKGTVVKKATVALYCAEIDALYDTIDASTHSANEIAPPPSWTSPDLVPWLSAHASSLSDKEIHAGGDIFDQGFDSLNATFLRHRIVGAMNNSSNLDFKTAALKIPQDFVYSHPTIEALAAAVSALCLGTHLEAVDPKVAVEQMILKYSAGLSGSLRAKTRPESGEVVLLTGSTGGLGSHLLEILLKHPSIRRVYALNRYSSRASSASRQSATFLERGLDAKLLLDSDRLVFLEGTAADLDPSAFETVSAFIFPLALQYSPALKLRNTISAIIHNAWTLDFNKSLASFEPHIKGTRNLIDLALASDAGVRLLFTSSVGTAVGWDPKRGPFPEELQLDPSAALGLGYGESKYVAERIIAASGLDATSFRIGQICGSGRTGAWSTSDWVPSLVKSSIALGALPSEPAGMNAWLSPEAVAQAIIDVALCEVRAPGAMNLVHPRPVTWDTIMSGIAGALHLPLIAFPEWIERLKTAAVGATAEDFERVPGIKLLEFFQSAEVGTGAVRFATSVSQEYSPAFRDLKPLDVDDAERWIGFWREKHFI